MVELGSFETTPLNFPFPYSGDVLLVEGAGEDPLILRGCDARLLSRNVLMSPTSFFFFPISLSFSLFKNFFFFHSELRKLPKENPAWREIQFSIDAAGRGYARAPILFHFPGSVTLPGPDCLSHLGTIAIDLFSPTSFGLPYFPHRVWKSTLLEVTA